MKKIPSLYLRDYDENGKYRITETVNPACAWAVRGEGIPTVKIDGSCCAVFNGVFYRRYDAKRGRTPPEGAVPCCDPDPVTGHWPHWVRVSEADPANKWFLAALKNTDGNLNNNVTFEAVGPHFRNNPYRLEKDILVEHGTHIATGLDDLSCEGIKKYLACHAIEGIVFWKDLNTACKIKRKDYGLPWPVETAYY